MAPCPLLTPDTLAAGVIERQFIALFLLLAFILFILGVIAAMSGPAATAVCWGLAALLALASIVLWGRVTFREALTPRRGRG